SCVTAGSEGSVSLDARTRVRLGRLDLDVTIHAADGETIAVLGPNGAGKTTLLRALAGLLRLDAGRVVIDGTVVEDTQSNMFLPREARPAGVVSQTSLLSPPLPPPETAASGLRSRGGGRRAAGVAARDWLVRVGLTDHHDARPNELSGGQQQRVAL